MQLESLFNDKTLKPKARTELLSKLILEHTVTVDELILFASKAKDPIKATCIESLEFASSINPGIVNSSVLSFVTGCLKEKAPRVKWESAKVIGNTIHLFPEKIELVAAALLDNTEDAGTVVRWSAAYALSQVLKQKTAYNIRLIPIIKSIIEKEEKNSIKKIYLDALKK